MRRRRRWKKMKTNMNEKWSSNSRGIRGKGGPKKS